MSQINRVCKKYNKDLLDTDVVELRKILIKNMGYFDKMSEWVFSGKSTITEIRDIVDLLQIVKINKSISSFKNSEQLYDHICEVRNKRKLNQIVKSIPSNSRKNVSSRIESIIYNNIDKEDLFKDFFSKKGGTCKTEDDLYQNISEIINTSEGGSAYKDVLSRISSRINFLNRKSVLQQILGFIINPVKWTNLLFGNYKFDFKKHGKIVYKDGETIIVEVSSFILSVAIGSRHWCISNRKTYWDNYVGNEDKTIQYFIYQTKFDSSNKESMIGTTVRKGGIKRATHFRNDDSCIGDVYLSKYSDYLKGSEVDIDYITDVIKYKITDLNVILSFTDWERIFDRYEYKYCSPSSARYYGNRYYQRDSGNYGYGLKSNMSSYLSKILSDIYTNRDKYDHKNICNFSHMCILYMWNTIPKKKMSMISNIINYDSPYFCDDDDSKDRLTYLKVVNYILPIFEADYKKWRGYYGRVGLYDIYGDRNGYSRFGYGYGYHQSNSPIRENHNNYNNSNYYNYVIDDITNIMVENPSCHEWYKMGTEKKVEYINSIFDVLRKEDYNIH